ncbi:potassium channel family protein [Clostridium sp. cel8]|uniref:potassium channel family protein n=1 Tax=unclassified Clostridium TaxID=2614128 RepID=UPI001FABB33A|nr:potassium channel family protein [Clostridium sp. cel8]
MYWNIANHSNGEFFIFQNDINLDTKVNVFKKKMKINNYNSELDASIRKLILTDEYKRPVVKLNVLNNSIYKNCSFVFDRTLGENWADYYYFLMLKRKATHISVTNMGESKINGGFNSYKLKVNFYLLNDKSKDRYLIYDKTYLNEFRKIDTIYIWVDNYDIIKKEYFGDKSCIYPLNFYFQQLMKNSICFPDKSPFVLKEVSYGNFTYPIWNFIYFSAVTITTLGYGDILPNSTVVRIMVIIETIIGVVVSGVFVSLIFFDKD